MNLIKWVLVFTVAFLVAWVLIFTFTQPPFYQQVPVKIFSYQTAPVPMYAFVSGAFGLGLLLGLFIALFYYISKQAEIFKKSKKIRLLESDIIDLKSKLEQKQIASPTSQLGPDQSQPSLPENIGGIQ